MDHSKAIQVNGIRRALVALGQMLVPVLGFLKFDSNALCSSTQKKKKLTSISPAFLVPLRFNFCFPFPGEKKSDSHTIPTLDFLKPKSEQNSAYEREFLTLEIV